MNIEELRDYCLSMPYSSEKMPFDEKVLVFYVDTKMFCLVNIENFKFINLKCDPDKAIELRNLFEEVQPAYHMNKKHWNSVYITGKLSNEQIKKWILYSYNLVFESLTKKRQKELLSEE